MKQLRSVLTTNQIIGQLQRFICQCLASSILNFLNINLYTIKSKIKITRKTVCWNLSLVLFKIMMTDKLPYSGRNTYTFIKSDIVQWIIHFIKSDIVQWYIHFIKSDIAHWYTLWSLMLYYDIQFIKSDIVQWYIHFIKSNIV